MKVNPMFTTTPIKTCLEGHIKSACDILKTDNCIAEQCETLSVDVLKNIDLAEPVLDCENTDLTEGKLEANDIYNEEFISIAESLIEKLTEITNNKLVYPEENTDLIKLLAGYVAYRVNKKGLKSDFQYGERTGNSNNSDWVSVLSKGAALINPSPK
ncbi:hypothetical protein J6590_075571 [Homalodisca vitripennis]|nr:hypothetical protein J6590_093653 [Homalodisca vitripennis]KAG8329922.1 hypothetical protein J6590_075571 [Homalodisca vitripennis]